MIPRRELGGLIWGLICNLKKSETHVFIFHSEKEEPSSFEFFCAYELHSPRSTYQGMVESIYLQQAAADRVTSKEISFWISVA